MYKSDRDHQYSIEDFDQPVGLKMNPENRWIRRSKLIPWEKIEDRYAELFPSNTGMPAKPLRMALGSLLISKQLGVSDRELVQQITENPYLQYFIGLPGYQMDPPFSPSLMVEFRRRLSEDILNDINEMIIEANSDENDGDKGPGNGSQSGGSAEKKENEDPSPKGTLILDATCAPQYISFPQDYKLLNECREKLEETVKRICHDNEMKMPRMYRRKARKTYLGLAKQRRKGKKKIRQQIRKQLQFVARDLRYIDRYLEEGIAFSEKELKILETIRKVYDQQKYMYDNRTHSVADRIVSLSQPYIRPIVRGKAKNPTEFGAKLDLSIDSGMARIEKLSFDAYNECEVLPKAIERYHERHGYYPERVLADTIYRNRDNLSYCKEREIRLSGPPLGRPKKDKEKDRESKKQAYQDGVDRIEVERSLSLCKRKYGLECITTKREDTTKSSIVLSVIAMNIDSLLRLSLSQILRKLILRIKRYRNSFWVPVTGIGKKVAAY